jgi:hypothetical protein
MQTCGWGFFTWYHTKVILCLEASCVNMLVKIENDLFEKGYKGQLTYLYLLDLLD